MRDPDPSNLARRAACLAPVPDDRDGEARM